LAVLCRVEHLTEVLVLDGDIFDVFHIALHSDSSFVRLPLRGVHDAALIRLRLLQPWRAAWPDVLLDLLVRRSFPPCDCTRAGAVYWQSKPSSFRPLRIFAELPELRAKDW
jgi:hypothetical protein